MNNHNAITLAILSICLAACAGHPDTRQDAANEYDNVMSNRGTQLVLRRSVGISQAGIHYGRSVHIDPIIRPLSNTLSFSSLLLKSARGMLRRTAIRTIQSPSLAALPIPQLGFQGPMDLEQWEHDLDRITGQKRSRGRIRYLVDGEDYFNRLSQAIDDARETIDIRTYIFDNDDVAVRVADQLKRKSADVRVRVMIDGIGNILAQQADADSMPKDIDLPFSMSNYLGRDSRVRVRTLTNPWFTGDHTKTTIIDGKTAFVGGMNIGREYRYDWHDLMLEVDGPVVDDLQFDHDKAWARASLFGDLAGLLRLISGKKERAQSEGYPIRVLYTRELDSQIYRAQLEAIRRSRSYIIIENAYFADDTIVYELAKARRRGVDVRVILPSSGNHGPTNASNRVSINHLLKNGIRVYEYPGMSHVKAAVYDGWACVGSANFDKLSLEINKELNLATSHPQAVAELLEKVLLPDLAQSREIFEQLDVTMPTRLLEIAVDELL